MTVAQLAIAWVLAQGQDIVALVGARTRDRLAESISAFAIHLTSEDLNAIEGSVKPNAGPYRFHLLLGGRAHISGAPLPPLPSCLPRRAMAAARDRRGRGGKLAFVSLG